MIRVATLMVAVHCPARGREGADDGLDTLGERGHGDGVKESPDGEPKTG